MMATRSSTAAKAGSAASTLRLCEDPRHGRSAPHVAVRKSRDDGVTRCEGCRVAARQTAAAVGTRGLGLDAYLRAAPEPPRRVLQVNVSSTSAGSRRSVRCAERDAREQLRPGQTLYRVVYEAGAVMRQGRDLQSAKLRELDCGELVIAPGEPIGRRVLVRAFDGLEGWVSGSMADGTFILQMVVRKPPEPPIVHAAVNASASSRGGTAAHVAKTPVKRGASAGGSRAKRRRSSSDVRAAGGRDSDSDWMSDELPATPAPTRRRTAPATSRTDTRLPADPPVQPPHPRVPVVADGCLDIYRQRRVLQPFRPGAGGRLAVYAIDLNRAAEEIRLDAEKVLHEAFQSDGSQRTITELCGLRPEGIGRLRSGKIPSRKLAVVRDRWLLWQTVDGLVHGAAILARQVNTQTGPLNLRGGMTLEYIAVRKDKGAKGFPLVAAAEEVSRQLGFSQLFSAADLTTAHAVEAHRRWEFAEMRADEWRERKLHGYTRESRVLYMAKTIPSPDEP